MNLHSFQRLLRDSWERVAIFTMVGIIVAMAISLVTTPKFVASSEIFLSTPRFNNASSVSTSPYQSDAFTQERARSYVQLADREDLARRVIEKLGIDMRPEDLAAATSASVLPDTVLIDISVESDSAGQAKVLADAMTAELAKDIRTLESRAGLGVPVVEPIVTQPAETPQKPTEPKIPLFLLYGASGGFLIGITLVSLLAGRRVDGSQIEAFTGRPVLGRITSDPFDSDDVADGDQATANRLRRQWQIIHHNVAVELEHYGVRVLGVTAATAATASIASSATAHGLAAAFAGAGSRVVLVSLQPEAHDSPRTRDAPAAGLAEVLGGELGLHDAIVPSPVQNLYHLTGPEPESATSLLRSDKFREAIDQLRISFDLVVVDSINFLQLAESTSLPEVVDSIVFVVLESDIARRDLASAVLLIESCQVRLMGSILKSNTSGKTRSRFRHDFVTVNRRA